MATGRWFGCSAQALRGTWLNAQASVVQASFCELIVVPRRSRKVWYEDCVGPSSYWKAQGLPVRVWGLLANGVLHITVLPEGNCMNRWWCPRSASRVACPLRCPHIVDPRIGDGLGVGVSRVARWHGSDCTSGSLKRSSPHGSGLLSACASARSICCRIMKRPCGRRSLVQPWLKLVWSCWRTTQSVLKI